MFSSFKHSDFEYEIKYSSSTYLNLFNKKLVLNARSSTREDKVKYSWSVCLKICQIS